MIYLTRMDRIIMIVFVLLITVTGLFFDNFYLFNLQGDVRNKTFVPRKWSRVCV